MLRSVDLGVGEEARGVGRNPVVDAAAVVVVIVVVVVVSSVVLLQ